jgi:predicted ATP-dependent endonuclease of OLD family
MKYKSFYIKNYKGIKELTLDLEVLPPVNITTLVGLNESGKTTILEAISMIVKDVPDSDKHKLIPKSKKFNFNDTIEVHATLLLDEKDQENLSRVMIQHHGYFSSMDKVEEVTIKKILSFRNSVYVAPEDTTTCIFKLEGKKPYQQYSREYVYDSVEYKAAAELLEFGLAPKLIYYPNFLFDFPSRIYLEPTDDEEKEQATYRDVINDIIDTFDEGLTIDAHIIARLRDKNQGNEEALEATLERMSRQITSVVFTAWGDLFDSAGKEIKLKAGIDDKDRCFLEVRLKEGGHHFQISERSLGFKWFFTFLLFTEFRKNRSHESGEMLFLLDEPASNLHSTAQKNLLTTFEKLVSKCKMIYTTHSHHLINPKWLSNAYVVKNQSIDYERGLDYVNEEADIEAILYKKFVIDHPQQRTYFQPVLDAIEYSPGLLEEVPDIVLTEGKNDYYTFRYIDEIIFGNEPNSLKLYPGNGADRNNQIIATYLAWGRDFTIFLDGDAAGETAKKRYQKEFGVVLDGNVVTLKDIDATFAFPTENLFTPAEQLEIIKTFDPTATAFNKSKFNTAIQSLFIQ